VARPLVSGEAAPGTLWIVSTPIGNLGDMTHRGVAVLGAVTTVLAEDTRHARTLLTHYDIATPLEALHEHNEAKRTEALLDRLAAGASFALVSDAGTPLVSDPGARLVRAAIARGLPVVPVPGASAVLAALVGSGLGEGPFTFLGFLPRTGGDRTRALAAAATLPHPAVVYEAPGRVADTLADLAATCGATRPAVVARELTKKFEEFRRGTLGELAAYYERTAPKGEVVLVIDGAPPAAPPDDEELRMRVRTQRAEGARPRDIMAALMAQGVPRNQAWKLAHEEPA
jgi:16S rRNA (cytidine1402-2'-O)-methyltransferase